MATFRPTVGDLFKDFNGRRIGLINALTTDVDNFFQQCDPGKKNLCLYGYPSGDWSVDEHLQEVPPEIPEPVLGINFARDGFARKEWLSLVAGYSDSWLLSVAYYFALRFEFSQTERLKLFKMINKVLTVSEAVNVEFEPPNDQSGNPGSSNSKSSKKKPTLPNEEEGEAGKDGDELCGVCGEGEAAGEFWICCDVCQTWLHGDCVGITAAKAKRIKEYKCRNFYNNSYRARV